MKSYDDFLKHTKIEIPKIEINPLNYEDSLFKEMADDIKQSNKEIDDKLDKLIQENKKSSKTSTITLIVGILTLLATVVGVLVQLF